jgi:hypothetical protein
MGRGCGTVFFGIFAAIGLIVTVAIGFALWNEVRTNFWVATPCTILTSELQEKGKSYRLDLTYHYTYEGREFTGSRLKATSNEFDNAAEAQRAARRFRGDQTSTCYVNPKAPEESVLEQRSPWILLVLLFPLLFVTIGSIGLIAVWKGGSTPKRAISETHVKPKSAATALLLIGIFFVLIGGVVTYFLSIGPWLRVRESAAWQETPCTILSSGVKAHRSDKGGNTYSIDIRYRYSWQGEELIGDRYNFDMGSSSGYDWRKQIVNQYPPGTRTRCYVNPNDPLDTVLVRDSNSGWWGLLPGVFVLAGIGMIFGARKTQRSESRTGLRSASLFPERGGELTGSSATSNGPTTLKPANSPIGAFIFLLIFALFWNGVVWTILAVTKLDTGAKVFLGLFAAIGVLILLAALHQFLALFNPRPILQASSGSVRLGESIEVRFQFTGRVQRIQRLTLKLEGKEVATYRRGTDTVTDKSVFAEIVLLDTTDRAQMQSGTVTAVLPSDSMHTFEARNNKIVWTLHLHGAIPRWPDVSQEFEINVLPHAIPAPEPSTV